jgi:hypothetical protein
VVTLPGNQIPTPRVYYLPARQYTAQQKFQTDPSFVSSGRPLDSSASSSPLGFAHHHCSPCWTQDTFSHPPRCHCFSHHSACRHRRHHRHAHTRPRRREATVQGHFDRQPLCSATCSVAPCTTIHKDQSKAILQHHEPSSSRRAMVTMSSPTDRLLQQWQHLSSMGINGSDDERIVNPGRDLSDWSSSTKATI